jgi:purine-nucleoside phosphorylase
MIETITRQQVDEAVAFIQQRTVQQPQIGLVLGSGLGSLADAIKQPDVIPFAEIPHFPVSSVLGHAGRMLIGQLEGRTVLVLQGRVHYYEGYSMGQVTFPIRLMQFLGIKIVILTNAAGGLNTSFRAGDVMLITDHINLIGMAGNNPLRGRNEESFGTRFPDMSEPYDAQLQSIALKTAMEQKIDLKQGVYMCLAGPSFESPADIRFLRMIGADAVGMSTVPETIVARHGGLRVIGLAGISNSLPPEGVKQETTHQEVLDSGRVLVPKMVAIVRGVLRSI